MSLNKIYYGPPGTGKTYLMQNLREYYTDYIITDEEIKNAYINTSEDWVLLVLLILQNDNKLLSTEIEDKLSDLNVNGFDNNVSTVLEQHSLSNDPLFSPVEPIVFVSRGNYWSVKVNNIINYNKEFFDEHLSLESINERYKYVTFHQSFVYEDFIEGIRPVLENNESDEEEETEIKYTINDGVFKQICEQAQNDPDKDFAIFIDAINRGNISEIFGELITLIEDDKRLGNENEIEVTLPYSKKKFGVPKNLVIIGTMNSADRSIALLDIALRRRFEFINMQYDLNEMSNYFRSRGLDATNIDGINLQKLLKYMNQKIELLLDANFVIGHGYFFSIRNLENLIFVFKNKIIPLLEEYFYEDYEKIQMILNDLSETGDLKENAIYKHKVLDADSLFHYQGELGLESKKSYYISENLVKESFQKVYEEED